MAFQKFEPTQKSPRMTIRAHDGKLSLHLNKEALEQFHLAPGENVDLFWDPETESIGLQKNEKGEFHLASHKDGAMIAATAFAKHFDLDLENKALYRMKVEGNQKDAMLVMEPTCSTKKTGTTSSDEDTQTNRSHLSTSNPSLVV